MLFDSSIDRAGRFTVAEAMRGGWLDLDLDWLDPGGKYCTLFWWNPKRIVWLCKDAVCLTSSRVGHMSVQFVCVPLNVLVCGVETCWEVCWLKLSRMNSRRGQLQTLSEMWEQENKQDARGQDSEQRGGGGGPCVCTAACHQRAVKVTRPNLFF